MAGLEAATLVDRDVDQHRARPHPPQQRAAHQLGRGGARHQHGADHQVGVDHRPLDRVDRRVDGVELGAELLVELLQPVERAVDHRDMGLHAHRHPGRVGPRHAAADDDDVRRCHARHAAEQHAGAARSLLQAVRADLHRHAAGDLAHRRQERQAAAGVGHRLVGDCRAAGLDEVNAGGRTQNLSRPAPAHFSPNVAKTRRRPHVI